MRTKWSVNLLLELSKVKITFAVSFTTIAGYMLSKGSFDLGLVLPTIGIFLLACGSSALNHYQDADRDKLMKRTASRPIPSGKISRTQTLIFAIMLSALGSALLYIESGLLAMQLGILAMIWYNGIYTPLKRKTAFAVIPGSVIGSIPPLVGWVAGGGHLFTVQALLLAFFFFIWQVPHFWLLMLKYGPEYTNAGYPSITQIYSEKSIRFMTFVWTFATAVSALLLPLFGLIANSVLVVIILLSVVWLVFTFAGLLRQRNLFSPFFYFMRINYFVLAVILSLIIDPLLK